MKRFLAVGSLLFFIALLYIGYVTFTLPDVQSLKSKNPQITALMEQRAREHNQKARPIRSWVPYNDISPNLRNAVLISEDDAFFQHSGYDLNQIKEAAEKDIREGRFARGASTITQQLAKNLYLSTSRDPLRKIRELFIAQEMERFLSKQRIFEIYLNVIEWGDGVYGVGPAAQLYFGKTPAELLPEEGAILSAMIPNPRRYTPATNRPYLEKRKDDLLSRLAQYRHLSKEEYDAARLRPVIFRPAFQTP